MNFSVKTYKLREALSMIGETMQNDAFHVHFDEASIIKNPFNQPFLTHYTSIIQILSGGVKFKINGRLLEVPCDHIIIFPSDSVIEILEINGELKTNGITFSNNFFNKTVSNVDYLRVHLLFANSENLVSGLPKDLRQILATVTKKLHKLNCDQRAFYSEERIFHLFNYYFLEVMQVCYSKIETIHTRGASGSLFTKFLKLLDKYITEHRSVKFYADKLCISSDYLTRVLKEVSDQSAIQLIEAALMIRARHLLTHSTLSIAQTAYQLNFADQSSFGKFFKRIQHMSPKSYREYKLGGY